MLSKGDLIFFGAAILLAGHSSKDGIQYITDSCIKEALDLSKQLYKGVFVETENDVILE